MNNHLYLTYGDKKVFRIGLGTNRIQDDPKSKEALKKAVSLGVNFIDTASAYTGGTSEKVIGETLSPHKNLFIATKGGMSPPDFHVDASPETLSKQLNNSLEKLRVKTIDLYFLHRVDPNIPLKESVQFLKRMQDEGKIKHIGLSNVTIEQIEEARKIADITTIENEYNLSNRENDNVIDYCEKENIIFVPFFPLHFQFIDNEAIQGLQDKYHATDAQLALAWILKRSSIMLPIPGSLSPKHLQENVDSVKIQLSDEDYATLSSIAK